LTKQILAILFVVLLVGCSGKHDDTQKANSSTSPLFHERTDIEALSGYHFSEPTEFEMPGIMGSGCAMINVNEDERLDLLLVPGDPRSGALQEDSGLCRVLLQEPDRTFRDVSRKTQIRVRGFGMGVFGGDIDNDGDIDILTTSASGILLFRNDGNLDFEDVTETSGVQTSHWATAAVFFDYNRDGWLDLFLVNYVDYFPGSICEDGSGRRDYCGPISFNGTADLLYRNRGAEGQPGVFENVTIASGLARTMGKGLGAICSDFNGDRIPDIYVANDMEANFLWIQDAYGKFENEASLRGCATDLQGRPQASMGTVFSDLDQDGNPDLFLTHLRGETNTLYRQFPRGVFLDQTSTSGLGEGSLNQTGFGVVARDLNLDGFPDLAIVNGRVMRAPLLVPGTALPHWEEYAEQNQIFLGAKDGHFRELNANSDAFVVHSEVSRGLASGDFDNDGDIDLLVSNIGADARLYENVAERKGHWLQLRVLHPGWKRDAVGARVTLTAGNQKWTAEVAPCTGYLSCHDPRIHWGLGSISSYDSIDVIWPDEMDRIERFGSGSVDQELVLEKGRGTEFILPESAENR
jgi:hypothetical protein